MDICPYCASPEISYMGIDDGGGDYGSSICDYWSCDNCGATWEGDCYETDDGQADVTTPDEELDW